MLGLSRLLLDEVMPQAKKPRSLSIQSAPRGLISIPILGVAQPCLPTATLVHLMCANLLRCPNRPGFIFPSIPDCVRFSFSEGGGLLYRVQTVVHIFHDGGSGMKTTAEVETGDVCNGLVMSQCGVPTQMPSASFVIVQSPQLLERMLQS